MSAGIHYYISADFSIDKVFQILKVAIVGEIDFIGEHALQRIKELIISILITGIIRHQGIEDLLDGSFVVV